MHLPIVCPTYPTRWGKTCIHGSLSLKPGPIDRARWGICQHCALTRIIKNKACLPFMRCHNSNWNFPIWGMGVWTGVEPYNYAPYVGLSTQSIGQIPHHSSISPQVGEVGLTIVRCITYKRCLPNYCIYATILQGWAIDVDGDCFMMSLNIYD